MNDVISLPKNYIGLLNIYKGLLNNYKGLLNIYKVYFLTIMILFFFSHTKANDLNACSTLIAIVNHTFNLKMIYLNNFE